MVQRLCDPRKYFDSGDYAIAKSLSSRSSTPQLMGQMNGGNSGAVGQWPELVKVGTGHPRPDTIPHGQGRKGTAAGMHTEKDCSKSSPIKGDAISADDLAVAASDPSTTNNNQD